MAKVFTVKKLTSSIELRVFASQKKFAAEHSWTENDFTEVLLSNQVDIEGCYAGNDALAEAIYLAASPSGVSNSFRVHMGLTNLEKLTLVLLFRKVLSEKCSHAKMEVLESVPDELLSNEGYLELIKEHEQRSKSASQPNGQQTADNCRQQSAPLDREKLVNAIESELAAIQVRKADAMKRDEALEAVEHSCELKAYTKFLRLIRSGHFDVTE